MRIRLIAPLAAVSLVLVACSSATKGKVDQTIDVDHAKITSTVKVSVPSNAGTMLLSPDGRRVLVGNDGKLCVSDVDGTHNACSTTKVSADVTRAAWSPDSTHVAFTDDFYKFFLEPDIWVMDASTGKATDLTDDGTQKIKPGQDPPANTTVDLFPSWSADSKSVRFARQTGSFTGTTIDVDSVAASGGDVSRLGTLDGRLVELAGLAFAPDGKTIAWSHGEDSGWSNSTVHVRKVGGGKDHALSGQPVKGDQSLLSFSPDGQYLLVDSQQTYSQYSCCTASSARVYAADGSGDAQQVAKDAIALYPGWAPSGHALAYSTPGPHSSLDLVAEPGAAGHLLKSATGRIFGTPNTVRMQWTPGGLFVYQGDPAIYRLGT